MTILYEIFSLSIERKLIYGINIYSCVHFSNQKVYDETKRVNVKLLHGFTKMNPITGGVYNRKISYNKIDVYANGYPKLITRHLVGLHYSGFYLSLPF